MSVSDEERYDVLVAELQSTFDEDPTLGEVTVGQGGGQPGTTNDIIVTVTAPDDRALRSATTQVQSTLEAVDGLTDVRSDLTDQRPVLKVEVNRTKAAALGFTASEVGQAISEASRGTGVGTVVLSGESREITVRPQSTGDDSPAEIAALELPVSQLQQQQAVDKATDALEKEQDDLEARQDDLADRQTSLGDQQEAVADRQESLGDRQQAAGEEQADEAEEAQAEQLAELRDSRQEAREGLADAREALRNFNRQPAPPPVPPQCQAQAPAGSGSRSGPAIRCGPGRAPRAVPGGGRAGAAASSAGSAARSGGRSVGRGPRPARRADRRSGGAARHAPPTSARSPTSSPTSRSRSPTTRAN